MNRLFFTLILLLITFSWSFGQGPFRVIFSTGNNYEKNERGFFQLNNGTLLHPEDEIVVMPNGIVILMDSEGRLLQLEMDGRYIVSSLDLSNLSSPSELIYQEWESYYSPKRQILATVIDDEPVSEEFHLDFPSSTEVYGRYIDLEWPNLNERYQVTLYDEYDQIIDQGETDLTNFRIDLLSQALAFRDFIGLSVSASNSKRSTGLTVLDKMAPPREELLDQLLRIFPEDNDLIIGLTKAIIFNNRGLYADASTLLRSLSQSNEGKSDGFYRDYLNMNGF
uniref:hypothetical protein n=1 Tax=Roseivirga sp. TaxID=1964215 RepID=UPI004048B435